MLLHMSLCFSFCLS